MIRSYRRLTVREISEDLNISYGSVQNILTTDLNMRRVSAKFVPRVLTVEQKQQRLSLSLELRDRVASDSSFLGNVITGDETLVYGYGPEARVQSSQWKNHAVLPVRKNTSIKIQHQGDDNCVFDLDGIVRAEFVPRNTTVNYEYYKGLLESLRKDVRRKQPEKWANGFIIHNENAPCHTSLPVRKFLSNKNITVCPHPLIRRIWHRATFGSSPKSKCHEK